MSSRTFYVGAFVHCKTLTTLEIVEHGTICVDDDTGAILSVQRVGVDYTSSDAASLTPRSLIHEKLQHPTATTTTGGGGSTRIQVAPKNHFFFPGLIDTHIHASQYPNAGIFGKSTLLDWLNKYTFPLESSLSSAPLAARVYTRCVARSLSAGTTTAAYYATQDASSTNVLATTVHGKGQRGFVGRCGMDSDLSPPWYRDASAQACTSATRACWEFCKDLDPTGRVQSIVTPRFAPSCSREALAGLGDLLAEGAPSGLRCQTHIAENPAELALVRELFPEFDSYAAVYDGFGLLTDRTVLAHAVHLSDDEIALVRRRGAAVAHCPTSNLALGSGDAKVRKLLDAGIPVGLGTDVSGGYDVNVLAAARAACLVSRSVAITQGDPAKLAVEEALYMATRGGAKVLRLEELVGAFEVGMQWDACLVGLDAVPDNGEGDCDGTATVGPVDLFGWETWEDRIAKWLYSGDDRNIRKVWVAGAMVHQKTLRENKL